MFENILLTICSGELPLKTIINKIYPVTLEEFADKHGLIMEVNERYDLSLPKFYAQFKGVYRKAGEVCIERCHGNGNTPEEAIEDYQNKISGKNLILHRRTEKRKEVWAPNFS